jgi:D-alanine-D-alanine ligase-like ATP-grasp enzyme
MDESEVDYPVIEPDERKMIHLVAGLQKKFGLDLLGIDVIIENGTGRYAVIDINVFPGTCTRVLLALNVELNIDNCFSVGFCFRLCKWISLDFCS